MKKYRVSFLIPLGIGIVFAIFSLRVAYANVVTMFLCWIVALLAGVLVQRGFVTTAVFCLVSVGGPLLYGVRWMFDHEPLSARREGLLVGLLILVFGILLPVALSWLLGLIGRHRDNAASR
jgi:hypothetical protein